MHSFSDYYVWWNLSIKWEENIKALVILIGKIMVPITQEVLKNKNEYNAVNNVTGIYIMIARRF